MDVHFALGKLVPQWLVWVIVFEHQERKVGLWFWLQVSCHACFLHHKQSVNPTDTDSIPCSEQTTTQLGVKGLTSDRAPLPTANRNKPRKKLCIKYTHLTNTYLLALPSANLRQMKAIIMHVSIDWWVVMASKEEKQAWVNWMSQSNPSVEWLTYWMSLNRHSNWKYKLWNLLF